MEVNHTSPRRVDEPELTGRQLKLIARRVRLHKWFVPFGSEQTPNSLEVYFVYEYVDVGGRSERTVSVHLLCEDRSLIWQCHNIISLQYVQYRALFRDQEKTVPHVCTEIAEKLFNSRRWTEMRTCLFEIPVKEWGYPVRAPESDETIPVDGFVRQKVDTTTCFLTHLGVSA
jgi:hypothetical protein